MAGIFLAASSAGAQTPSACDKLAGEEQKRCIRQQEQLERERFGREEQGREEHKPRTCDSFFGPEKEACLKRGGTVRAKAPGARHGE